MNIKKSILALAIIGASSLFAGNLNEVSTLVEKIKDTKDVIVKQELIVELNDKIEKMDKKTAEQAQSIIDEKLKKS